MDYLYIIEKYVDLNAPLKKLKCVSHQQLNNQHIITRIHVPPNLKPQKTGDGHFKINSVKSLNQIRYDILVKIDGKWKEHNELKGTAHHKIKQTLQKQNIFWIDGLNQYGSKKTWENYLKDLEKKG